MCTGLETTGRQLAICSVPFADPSFRPLVNSAWGCRARAVPVLLNACINAESRRCDRLSSFPLCLSSKSASCREFFHVASFDAKARSTAFSHQHIGGARMTDVFWGSLYGPLAQNLAAVTGTTKLRSPAHWRDLFWELIRCQSSASAPSLFRRYSLRSSP